VLWYYERNFEGNDYIFQERKLTHVKSFEVVKMITIEQLHKLCHDDSIVLTQHLTLRCYERGIEYDDIKATILNGEIIEQYPSDYPYPSCLMTCELEKSKNLHVVVGLGDSRLWIITAYRPDEKEWDSSFKTRKVGL